MPRTCRAQLSRMLIALKAEMAFCPLGIDSLGTDGIVSDSNLLTQSIQQLGLAVVHIAFLPGCCRAFCDTLLADKGLQGDQEDCATVVVSKRDSNVA